MSDLQIEARVTRIVAEQAGRSKDEITSASRLQDLGIDDLDQIELVMALEEEFGITITDLTPAVSQIHSHRQTIQIGANRVSPATFFYTARHRRRLQFSRQLCQDFREYFFRISLHRTSRFRPLHGWFTPLRRLAMLLQGRSPFSCDCTLSALLTASLTPSGIGDRPSHAIWFQQQAWNSRPVRRKLLT